MLMDKRILLTLALGAMSQVFTHAWEPKGDKIKTVWAEQVMPENVWQSYPRPQLQRAEWLRTTMETLEIPQFAMLDRTKSTIR